MIGRVESIDDVILGLETVMDIASQENNPHGVFAAVYRLVTIRVKEQIAAGLFEDGQRMEHLDVLFARRYFTAFDQYRQGEHPTASWHHTFRMAEQPHPLLIQHLLLGINAHINLDLGIAAFEAVPAGSISGLRHDYERINNILAELLDHVQAQIGEFSPAFDSIDSAAGQIDELLATTVLRQCRRMAWLRAERLARTDPRRRADLVARFDRSVYRYALRICPQELGSSSALGRLRAAEQQDITAILQRLS